MKLVRKQSAKAKGEYIANADRRHVDAFALWTVSCLCQLLLFFQWRTIQKYLENTVYSNRLLIATALATLHGMVCEKFIALHKLSCILLVSFFQQNLLVRTEVMIKRNSGKSQQNQTWIRNMDGKPRGL